jgi:hypothetical protein
MRAYLLVGASCVSVALWSYGCSEDESTLATATSSVAGPTTSTTTGPGSGGSVSSVGAGAQGGSAQGGAGGMTGAGGAAGMMSVGGAGGMISGAGGMMSGAGGMMSGAGGMMSGAGGMMSGAGGMMTGAGGAGGGSMCLTCSQYVQACLNMSACPSESLICQQSLSIYQPLEACTCATCSGQCTQTCSNIGTDSMSCFGCLAQAAQNNCPGQLQACLQD